MGKKTSREKTPSSIKEVQENKVLASLLIELLLRELLIQDKKGLEREEPQEGEKACSKERKGGPARSTKEKQRES